MRRILQTLFLWSTLCLSSSALSQEQNEALATELFNAGRDLMAEGRFAQACPKLEESARLNPAVGTLGKLASCDEKLGKLMLARTRWQQALNRALAESDERAGLIEQELRRLDGIVPKLRIVAPAARPAGMRVTLDGTELGESSFGVALPVDPGEHLVVVTAPTHAQRQLKLNVLADGATTVLRLPELEKPAERAEAPPPPVQKPVVSASPEADSSGAMSTHPLRSVGLVVAGVGMVSAGVGAYFGGLAKSRLDESDEMGCDGAICPPDAAQRRDEAREAGNASTVFFLAGGVLVAGGLGLWIFGPEDREEPAPRVSAVVTPTSAGGGVWMQGRLLSSTAIALGCTVLGCNSVIGAEEPIVSSEHGGSDAGLDEHEGTPVEVPSCGNGMIEPTEQCDDANEVATDGCHACEVQCGPQPETLGMSDWTCYWLGSAETKTWQDARAFCESWGGSLVTLSSLEEYTVFQNRISVATWVGAKFDSARESASWINGETWSNEPWSNVQTEPEGACVAIDGVAGALTRVPCDEALGFICERPPPGIVPDA